LIGQVDDLYVFLGENMGFVLCIGILILLLAKGNANDDDYYTSLQGLHKLAIAEYSVVGDLKRNLNCWENHFADMSR